MLFLSVIIYAIACHLAFGQECPDVPNPQFDPASRAAVVNRHNELRSKLVHGTAVYKNGGKLRSGKNIYQMYWDCDLEKQSQEWSNRCVFEHSPWSYRHAGENIFESWTSGTVGPLGPQAVSAVDDWWSEIKKYNAAENPTNTFGDDVFDVAGHWSQVSWGATTLVGCGVTSCGGGNVLVVCEYRVAGNMMGAPLFEWGNGCNADADCTTYSSSKCNTTNNLCIDTQQLGKEAALPESPKGPDGQPLHKAGIRVHKVKTTKTPIEPGKAGSFLKTQSPLKPRKKVSGPEPTVSGPECPDLSYVKFDPESRAAVVNRHNELRSLLAKGEAVYQDGGKLKAGKNIYQLQWDCDLEDQAQEWADRCVFRHSPWRFRHAGENIYEMWTSGVVGTIEANAINAVDAWWSELKKYDALINPTNKFNNKVFSVAGHWSQEAWGATTLVGCGISNCTTHTTLVVCQYRIAGNLMGAPIFDWGDGCSKDSDCTTYPGSTCDVQTKLCLVGQQAPKPDATSSNKSNKPGPLKSRPRKIPEKLPAKSKEPHPDIDEPAQECKSPIMTEKDRQGVIDTINYYRSALALGKVSYNGKKAEKGKNIYKLTYDCNLENKAQEMANKCPNTYMSTSGETLFNMFGQTISFSTMGLLNLSLSSWWTELSWYGFNTPNYIFTKDYIYNGINDFTQMAWGATTRIGCAAYTRCNLSNWGGATVLCLYRTPGNIDGQPIYEIGEPCQKDSDCTTYTGSKCSAEEGLCIKP